jgi:hypothetical protein
MEEMGSREAAKNAKFMILAGSFKYQLEPGKFNRRFLG